MGANLLALTALHTGLVGKAFWGSGLPLTTESPAKLCGAKGPPALQLLLVLRLDGGIIPAGSARQASAAPARRRRGRHEASTVIR